MRKRLYQSACWIIAIFLLSSSAMAAPNPGWTYFRQHFIDANGRVIDTGQDNISHSEGQGTAMLFAVNFNDRALFEQIWHWTRKNLQVRSDNLLAWRWTPGRGVTDMNDASDGDLMVAWSLLRAYNKWHAQEYLQASQKIAHDIREKLLRKTTHGLILLPGAEGFEKPQGITINLSYWIFPALDEITQADPAPEWKTLSQTGIDILQYARFGRWELPPDWLILTGKVEPSDGMPDRFGYNAVRIPLYLLWSRRDTPALLKPYRDFWGYFRDAHFLPAWTNLRDDSVDSYDASKGIHKLAQWVLDFPRPPPAWKAGFGESQGYYSSALALMTEMAANERAQKMPH